ncbi:MAG: type II secretion system protein GspM [SAR324 cluster bacterium]
MLESLSERERLLLAALAAVLAAAAALWGLQALGGYQHALAAQLDSDRATLNELRALDAELERSGGQRLQAPRSLAATLEDLLSRTGMRDRIQLNPVTQSGTDRIQAMEVKAEQLTLDEMVRLVYVMESPDLPVSIEQFEVGPSFRDKEMLRVTMRVLGPG